MYIRLGENSAHIGPIYTHAVDAGAGGGKLILQYSFFTGILYNSHFDIWLFSD